MQFNKKNNRLNKIIVNSIVLTAVLIFLSGPIREACVQILKFTSNFNQSVSGTISDGIERSVSTTKLAAKQKQELEALKAKIEKDKYQLSLLSTLANKVDALDRLLALKKERFPLSVAASVIARSPSSWHQQVLINKGSIAGLKQGMIVVTPIGILGQIQEVKPNYSVVQLVSSSQLKFGAEIQRTKVMGVLFGDKPGYAQLKFVPIGSDVQKGDLIQTTSSSPFAIPRFYPFAYPVGKVISVTRLSNNSEMFIRVKLFENASQAYDVLVLIPGGDKPSLIPLPKPAPSSTLSSGEAVLPSSPPIISSERTVIPKPEPIKVKPVSNANLNTNIASPSNRSLPVPPLPPKPQVIQAKPIVNSQSRASRNITPLPKQETKPLPEPSE